MEEGRRPRQEGLKFKACWAYSESCQARQVSETLSQNQSVRKPTMHPSRKMLDLNVCNPKCAPWYNTGTNKHQSL
ncbi:rCG49058 [Rattus norvegicus]|uniref:RCG49058 n=1 Tax=Rattus norvegicus TaxID=10116 RepID=A6IGR8_RAT|nr:rCG49058 [Rattus norvegicus]